MNERLLLVEDELSIATGLVDVLKVKGYGVDHAETGEAGLELAMQGQHALILLDAMLPGLSGFEVLRKLRQAGHSTPVIMLTARSTEMDRVLGFELGVDDYVTKPFSLLELLGRIGAVLRRRPAAPLAASVLHFGPVSVDFDRFVVSSGGQEIGLPAKAFDILKALAHKQGQAVTRDALMDVAWGVEECITLRTLNNLVVKIRQAIEPNPDEPRYLKTIHGVGYRLDVT